MRFYDHIFPERFCFWKKREGSGDIMKDLLPRNFETKETFWYVNVNSFFCVDDRSSNILDLVLNKGKTACVNILKFKKNYT